MEARSAAKPGFVLTLDALPQLLNRLNLIRI